jgi:hypothetical protein
VKPEAKVLFLQRAQVSYILITHREDEIRNKWFV